MQPVPPCSAPACYWQMQASGLLLFWELWLVCVFYLFIFLPIMFPPEIPKLPTYPLVRGFPGFWKLLLIHNSLPRMGLCSLSLLFLYLLYFVLPPFEDNGLPFWVPDVLCQHSEVVLWNLLSIQMIFWWICGGESDLFVLFLYHLRTTPCFVFL